MAENSRNQEIRALSIIPSGAVGSKFFCLNLRVRSDNWFIASMGVDFFGIMLIIVHSLHLS